MKNLIYGLLFLMSGPFALAQDSTNADPAFTFRIGLMSTTTTAYKISATKDTTYKNHLVVAPTLSILHESGLSLDYAAYLLTSGIEPGLYMHTVTLGYENYDGKNFTVRTGYIHYFFTGNKGVPYSPITNELYFASDYKKPWLRPAVALGYALGQDETNKVVSDFNAGVGVKHSFSFENAGPFSSIDLGPSLFVNAGTNTYYSFLTTSKYISRNTNAAQSSGNGRGRGRGRNSAATATYINCLTATNKFTLSNIELGIYSDLEMRHFHIKPQGSIFFPLRAADKISSYYQINMEYYF